MKENLYKIYAATSVIFFLFLILSPLKDRNRDWQIIQAEYRQAVSGRAGAEVRQAGGVNQIWVRDLDRIDRCTTCHISSDVDSAGNVSPLFKPHSKMHHDPYQWGCTICHEGQGAATSFKDAHFSTESWDSPVLPNRYLESACGKCHSDFPLRGAPHLSRGKELIYALNCNGCHDLPGVHDRFIPTLDGIGRKAANKSWLVSWLQEPAKFRPATRMPNFLFTPEQAEQVSDFLLTLTTFPDSARLEELPDVYLRRKNDPVFIERGRTLFREVNCMSCHAVNGEGGTLAVDLGKVATKANETWIFNFIVNPGRLQPGIEMPRFGFSPEQVAEITAYIMADFYDWNFQRRFENPPDSTSVAQGKKLFYQFNCTGCHQIAHAEFEQNRGPDNTRVGSKPIYQIYFENTTIPHTRFDYFYTKLSRPRIFGETMRMPKFNLSREDKEALTTYLLSLRESNLPERYLVRPTKAELFTPPGKVGELLQKYNCLKCHRINGNGNTIAPDLSNVGSRLRSGWIKQFLENPYEIRPLITENMLRLFLTDEEISTLVNFFSVVLIEDFPFDYKPAHSSPALIEEGKRLYREKYGCRSCHRIGGEGGALGPILDDASQRLKPEWIVNWLMNPQNYIPDTIEPRTGMSVSEAQKITTYLMNL